MSNRVFQVIPPAVLDAARRPGRKVATITPELLEEIERNSNEALREIEVVGKRLNAEAESIAKDLRAAYEGIRDENLRRVAKKSY